MYRVRVEAQGFHETDDGHLEPWRFIPAGERQIVARFQSSSVVDIFEDADALAPDSVPEEWARSCASDKDDEADEVRFTAPRHRRRTTTWRSKLGEEYDDQHPKPGLPFDVRGGG